MDNFLERAPRERKEIAGAIPTHRALAWLTPARWYQLFRRSPWLGLSVGGLCCLVVALLLWRQWVPPSLQSWQGLIGPYSVQLEVKEKWSEAKLAEVKARLLSTYQLIDREGVHSDIAKANRMAGITAVDMQPLTLDLIAGAIEFAKLFDRGYVPTLGPLLDLWKTRFATVEDPIPTRRELDDRLKSVDLAKVAIDLESQRIALQDANMKLDFQSILPGLLAVQARQVLIQQGVANARIQIENVVSVLGREKDQQSWEVTLADPDDPSVVLGVVVLQPGESLATVGGGKLPQYEKNGEHYHLLLDPRTGFPARACRSVTMVSRDPLTASFLAHGVFVLGSREGLQLAEQVVPGSKGLAVAANGKLILSNGLHFTANQ